MFYVIADTLLKVALNTNIITWEIEGLGEELTPLSTIFQLWCIIWRTVLLVFNHTFNNVLVIMYNITLLKLVNMFYAIANIVESGVKHQ
jgi:hypothetical protein